MIQFEQRQTELLHLLLAERPAVHAPNGLVLEHFAQQFYHGQDKSRKSLLNSLGVGVYPLRERSSDGG
jgi:hypothetical protein